MQDCNGEFNHLYFMNSFKTFQMQYLHVLPAAEVHFIAGPLVSRGKVT